MYLLLATAKLNDVPPQVWFSDVLHRVGKGHPINRIDELLPWARKAAQSGDQDVA
jgi:transposase